jgi:hypothetical protein
MIAQTAWTLCMAVVGATVEPQGFDSRSVAAAIRQAAPRDTIRLAAGTYQLSEPIRPKSKIRLMGEGQEKTILVYRGKQSSVLVDLTACEDVELAHMTLDGRSNPLLNQAISGSDSRRLWLHHLTIRNLANVKTWGPHAILFSGHNPTMERGVTDSRITDCQIYRCTFEKTVRGDPRATYPTDSGHGFRTNGNCRDLVFEDCTFAKNGGYGLQWGGQHVDRLALVHCAILGNRLAAVTGPARVTALDFRECTVAGNGNNQLPDRKPFPAGPPVADFASPEIVRAGAPAQFRCLSRAAAGGIGARLWDFGHGIPEVAAAPVHTFEKPGPYRVTLIVWDQAGRGGRKERVIVVR